MKTILQMQSDVALGGLFQNHSVDYMYVCYYCGIYC